MRVEHRTLVHSVCIGRNTWKIDAYEQYKSRVKLWTAQELSVVCHGVGYNCVLRQCFFLRSSKWASIPRRHAVYRDAPVYTCTLNVVGLLTFIKLDDSVNEYRGNDQFSIRLAYIYLNVYSFIAVNFHPPITSCSLMRLRNMPQTVFWKICWYWRPIICCCCVGILSQRRSTEWKRRSHCYILANICIRIISVWV